MGYDGVFADDSCAYEHARFGRAHDGAVADSSGSVYLAVVVDNGVGYLFGVDNLYVIAYGAGLGHGALYVFGDETA